MSDEKKVHDLWITNERGDVTWWGGEPEANRIAGCRETRIEQGEDPYVEFGGDDALNPADLFRDAEESLNPCDGEIAHVRLTFEVVEAAHEAWQPGGDDGDAAYDRMRDDMIERGAP